MISLGVDCFQERDCADYITKWGTWCINRQDSPLAMLPIADQDSYRKTMLDAKSRNMVVKAQRHFYYNTFNYNYHLGEIYDINTSSPHRQGKPMTPAYTSYPQAIKVPYVLCGTKHRYVHIGGFDHKGLKAYCALAIVGELAIINTIIGHCDYLTFGVMNGLIDYIVSYLHRTTGVTCLNYLDLTNCSEGMKRFKSSVGFRSMQVHFDY